MESLYKIKPLDWRSYITGHGVYTAGDYDIVISTFGKLKYKSYCNGKLIHKDNTSYEARITCELHYSKSMKDRLIDTGIKIRNSN